MFAKVIKTTAILALASSYAMSADYNTEAKKDQKALVDYFEAKFADPKKDMNRFFPYSTEQELANDYAKNVKFEDFAIGSYSYAKDAKGQYESLKEMPPYEEDIEAGEELFNKAFANGKSFSTCFESPAVTNLYPIFDESKNEVISLTQAVNDCLTSNGEKEWDTKKGNMAKLQAYMAYETGEAGKKVSVDIPSAAAYEAYERGKEYYYTQRGYLKMSCATCHVQGAGQRVRNEKLSPFVGQMTHFPVYRLKWGSLGTIERRASGCIVDQGQVPPKDTSKEMKELLYFMAIMSNDLPVDGPDLRK